MNDLEALMQLKKHSIRHSHELSSWYDAKFKKIVFRITIKFGFDQELAEDITQDVLLNAISKIESFRNESSLNTWLESIIRNACIDQIRKKTVAAKDLPNNALSNVANIICVTEKNGMRITEYSYVHPNKDAKRKLKFDIQYSKIDNDGSDDQSFDEFMNSLGSDFNLDEDTPETDLIQKDQGACIQNAISRFHEIDREKAMAIRMLLLDTPREEIATALNKNSKGIREYISQCYKKFKVFVQPCYEIHKLA